MDEKQVSAELIRRQGEELQGLSHDEARARELAAELERINRRVRESAERLEFDDEPLAYQARLHELAGDTARGPEAELDESPSADSTRPAEP